MELAGFLGTAVVFALLVNIVSTWLTTSKGSIPSDSPFGRLLVYWPITLLIGCCLLLMSLLAWVLSRWPLRSAVTLSLAQQDRARMIGRLRRSYGDLLAQTLQGIAWMDVALSEKPDAVRNAATLLLRSVNQPERLLPVGTSIMDAYNQAEHDLLILGTPGSGKSTLLLELAQQLVERAAQDAEQPFPVILPLSSWAVKRLPLQDWIIEQLTQVYDIPRRVSEQWVREDTILALLDGLDEMEEAARPACINAINIYHHLHLGAPLVICSRTVEYDVAAQRQRLTLQSAVTAQPLTSQQVDASLLQAGKPVAALRSAMKKNLALQELATTPLMLSVLMLTYQGTTARELPTKEAFLQQQVWTDYIARMVRRKGDETRYPLAQTRRWLTWLAQQMRMHQQTIFYAEYLHIDWLANKQQRTTMWLTIRVPALVLGALAALLISSFTVGFSPSMSIQIGLFGWFVGGCLSQKISSERVAVGRHLSISKRGDLLNCILLGELVGASFYFNLQQTSPYVQGYFLSDWLRDGSILGIGSGLSAWIFQMFLFRFPRQQVTVSPTVSPLRWRVSSWFTAIIPRGVWQAAIILGTGIGVSYGLSGVLSDGLSDGLYYGLYYGLSAGLSIGLAVVLISFILDASLASFRFAERIHWTWQRLRQPKHLRTSVIVTGVIFLLFGLDYWLGFGLSLGLSNGVSVGLSAGLSYWLVVGLYQGMVQEHVKDQDRHQFNQGIRRSLRNGMLVSLVSAGIIAGIGVLIGELSNWLFDTLNELSNGLGSISSNGLGVMLSNGVSNGLSSMLSNGLSNKLSNMLSRGPGPSFGLNSGLNVVWFLLISGFLLMWAISGGLTILRHYVIRWLLARSHRFPWRAQAFLDDATARILLQRVGGGYRFMHRLLLDYFADLETAPPSATSPISPPCSNHHHNKCISN